MLPQGTSSRALLELQEKEQVEWRVLLPRVKLGADRCGQLLTRVHGRSLLAKLLHTPAVHWVWWSRQVYFSSSRGELQSVGPVSHLRVTMYPDGGISRIRALGTKHGGSRL